MGCFNIGSFCVNTVEREWERRTARWETEGEWAREKERVLFYFHFFFTAFQHYFPFFPALIEHCPKVEKKMFCFLISLASNQVTKYLPTTKVTSYEKITIRKKVEENVNEGDSVGIWRGNESVGVKNQRPKHTPRIEKRENERKKIDVCLHTHFPHFHCGNWTKCHVMRCKRSNNKSISIVAAHRIFPLISFLFCANLCERAGGVFAFWSLAVFRRRVP